MVAATRPYKRIVYFAVLYKPNPEAIQCIPSDNLDEIRLLINKEEFKEYIHKRIFTVNAYMPQQIGDWFYYVVNIQQDKVQEILSDIKAALDNSDCWQFIEP